MPQLNSISVSAITGVRAQTAAAAIGETNRLPLLETLLTGLEIEAEHVEGDAWQANDYGWDTGGDGSLRQSGIEWRLLRPMYGQELSFAIEGLYNMVEAGALRFEGTPRAGTHIHINMTDQNFDMVQAMAAIMYCIDQLVFEWADDNRMWCSYCNSMNTLPVNVLQSLFREEVLYGNSSEVWPMRQSDRYYGFNITSLFKYGTVEFRYFPTTSNVTKLWEWLDFTHLVFSGAKRFIEAAAEDSVKDFILELARTDPRTLLEYVFGENTAVLRGLMVNDFSRKVREAAEELTTILSVSTNVSEWVEEGTAQLNPVDASASLAEALVPESYMDFFYERPARPTTNLASRTLTTQDAQNIMRSAEETLPSRRVGGII